MKKIQYELRTDGTYFGRFFKFYIVEITDNDRFVGGSDDKKQMLEFYRLLQEGNWYD